MEKIIQSLINNWIRGVDTYTHNGSTWLIFTDSKKWVIELTEVKTLWYNYNFFKQIFEFTSLNVVENQSYITKWVEDNIINKGELIRSYDYWIGNPLGVDDAIENGVKETYLSDNSLSKGIEYTIENGVKKTKMAHMKTIWSVEDTIENGVKETFDCDWPVPTDLIEDVINDGVKETKVCNYVDPKTKLMWVKWGNQIDEAIENGDKVSGTFVGGNRQKENIESVIGYGTKNPTV